jgi:hypothetical protein
MGFEAPETLFRLKFEDPDMAGLEVTVHEPTIDDLMAMSGIDAAGAKKMDPAAVKTMFKAFADLLDSWNLTRKGVPVPATLEGVTSQSPGFMMKVIAAMDKTIIQPDPTSSSGSSAGETSGLENSIPMTPLPPSQGSS